MNIAELLDIGSLFPALTDQNTPLTLEESLARLKAIPWSEIVSAQRRDIITEGVLFNYVPRVALPQVLAVGLLNDQLAAQRSVKKFKPRRSGHDAVCMAQLTSGLIAHEYPLLFHQTDAADYATADIQADGVLSTFGLVISPKPSGTWSVYQTDGSEKDDRVCTQLFTNEVPPHHFQGIVLPNILGYVGIIDDGRTREAIQDEISQSVAVTLQWLKEHILPYHHVPVYSQADGSVLFDP